MIDDLPWPLIDAALRGALVAVLAVIAWAIVPRAGSARQPARVIVGLALAVSTAVQAVTSAPWFEATQSCSVQAPWIGVSLGSSVLFWLFAESLFDETFVLRPWHALAWVAVVLLGATVCARLPDPAGAGWWLQAAMRAVPIATAGLALAAALSQWRADLVEPRRRLRVIVVAGGAIYAVAMVAGRVQSADGRLGEGAALLDTLALLAIVLLILRQVLRPDGSALWPVSAEPPAGASPSGAESVDAADAALRRSLDAAMTEARAYRQEGLTVASLAAQLRVPEYRLRRVINRHLGHRNFNAYVNGLRIAEAKARLADPAERQLPVLSIALDVGFQSIGPFNRAFKADTGLTPTDFRRRHGADGIAEA